MWKICHFRDTVTFGSCFDSFLNRYSFLTIVVELILKSLMKHYIGNSVCCWLRAFRYCCVTCLSIILDLSDIVDFYLHLAEMLVK
jgi:hypothetical protein